MAQAKSRKFLTKKILKTKRGCKWTQNGICRILTNRMYCGIIINGKEEVKGFPDRRQN
ncbi:MAG: recombinase family protein [Clostridiales bacterium]|nr:MAG: recombinase family protein [Clostridiales bacterium]